MPFLYITSPQLTAPSAAGAVSVTPSGTSWTNSAWVEVITSTASAIVLTGLNVSSPGAAVDFEVDVGTGAAGSEVVVTTFRGLYFSTSFRSQGYLPHVIPLDNIATGTRVAIRMRKNGTSTTAWTFALTYVAKPFTGTLFTSAQPQVSVPAAANSTALATTTTAWGNPAWTQLIASTPSAIVLVGVITRAPSNGVEFELDIGVGASGSEAVVTTIRSRGVGSNADGPMFCPLPIPLDNIGSGVRVSARMRHSGTIAGSPTAALVYQGKPL